MNKNDCLKTYELMIMGMIEKDSSKLKESMSRNAHLIHMTGKVETRDEYINDILDGTLNYYDYEILSFTESDVFIRLLAKVYDGDKRWWMLHMKTIYLEEDGIIKIKECKVGM